MHSTKTIFISLIIPHMPFYEADIALEKCLKSFEGQYDELIVVYNDGEGYGTAVNEGLSLAKGEYLVVSNNDIECIGGSLRNMPYNEGFSVPTIVPPPRDDLPRAIFCLPNWIYRYLLDRDGFFFDPSYGKGYFEDDDLHKRITNFPIIKRELTVSHLNGGGLTMKTQGEQEWFDKNQKVFNDKWS